MSEKELNEAEEELDDELIELIDDDGKVVKFRLLDVTEYKGVKYALLLAAEPDENIGEDEVAIFRYLEEEGVLEPIEDDELLQEVFDFYQQETYDEEEYGDGEEN